ncbi:hypothetical protein CW705_02850 [Candidatus Bathyarchaeota archaeon]|nr:MAG: hypothetical protein CW705_02850 [Candidatus Bathyarchaeota archaeon]
MRGPRPRQLSRLFTLTQQGIRETACRKAGRQEGDRVRLQVALEEAASETCKEIFTGLQGRLTCLSRMLGRHFM